MKHLRFLADYDTALFMLNIGSALTLAHALLQRLGGAL